MKASAATMATAARVSWRRRCQDYDKDSPANRHDPIHRYFLSFMRVLHACWIRRPLSDRATSPRDAAAQILFSILLHRDLGVSPDPCPISLQLLHERTPERVVAFADDHRRHVSVPSRFSTPDQDTATTFRLRAQRGARIGERPMAASGVPGVAGGASLSQCIERLFEAPPMAAFGGRQRSRRRLITAQCVEAFRLPSIGSCLSFDGGVDLCLNARD
jgi:hypothetical protein